MNYHEDRIDQLEAKLDILADTVSKLEARLSFFERDHAMQTGSADEDGELHIPREASVQPATVPRGKYMGRLHADVVQLDPQHIVWLTSNGLAAGLGYTEDDIAAAQELAQRVPAGRGRTNYPRFR